MGVGQTSVGQRVAGILGDGSLEMTDRFLYLGFGPLVGVIAAKQIQVVRLGLVGRFLLEPLLLLRGQGRGQRARNLLRQLALHLENVEQLAVVRLAPELLRGPWIDQARNDPHPRPGPTDAASRIVATPSSSAIAAILLPVFLYCIVDVRQTTFSAAILDSVEMMSSVTPSLKYSFSGSALMFSNGSTATDRATVMSWSIACAVPTAIATVTGVPRASANRAADMNRSAGGVAHAFFTAASTPSRTNSRPPPSR